MKDKTGVPRIMHCWPRPWIEAAMLAGFAHYKGDGEWVFINDKMRDMLADFAMSISERAEQERDELLAVIEKVDSLIAYQYSGSQEAMSALQDAAFAAKDVLDKVKGGEK
jgi:hypothetical protein